MGDARVVYSDRPKSSIWRFPPTRGLHPEKSRINRLMTFCHIIRISKLCICVSPCETICLYPSISLTFTMSLSDILSTVAYDVVYI